MERLDFCSITAVIREYCNEEKMGAQLNFVEKIFHSFVYGDDTDNVYFDEGQVCRWLKGQANISKVVISYYLESETRRDSLKSDIETWIVSILYDKEMTVIKLKELLLADTTISGSRKEMLLTGYGIESDSRIATFIADLLLFAMERKFVKRASDKKLITTGVFSPVISDYIFENDPPAPCRYFCGRDLELEELHEALKENGKIFLYGIAGIGKSELAKAYARKFKKEYVNILYITYSGSLTDDLAGLDFADDLPGETQQERLKKHNRFLRSLKADSLIIIDNYDTTTEKDTYLPVVMKYKCRILFATRSSFYDYEKLELAEINDTDALLSLAGNFYEYDDDERETICEIIQVIHCHTFTVELMARLLHSGILSPRELLQKLKEENVKLSSTDTIGIKKDGSIRKDSYYGHIHTLFSLSVLTSDQLCVMRYMSLVPLAGIDKRLFAKWTCQPDMNIINSLIELGFIRELPLNNIGLHPMIQEITIADTTPTITNCLPMLEYIQANILIFHGVDVPYARILFETIGNIMRVCSKDDKGYYLRFIEDALAYMDNYHYETGMREIIKEMEDLLKDPLVGTSKDRALLCDYSAMIKNAFDNNLDKALVLEEKAISLLPEADAENAMLISNVYTNYGSLLHKKKELVSAVEYMERGINILRDFHLESSNSMVIKICNYANLRASMGETDLALSALKKCKKAVKEYNTDLCHDYAILEENISRIYLAIGNIRASSSHLKKAIAVYNIIWEEQQELLEQKHKEIEDDYTKAGIRVSTIMQNILEAKP